MVLNGLVYLSLSFWTTQIDRCRHRIGYADDMLPISYIFTIRNNKGTCLNFRILTISFLLVLMGESGSSLLLLLAEERGTSLEGGKGDSSVAKMLPNPLGLLRAD